MPNVEAVDRLVRDRIEELKSDTSDLAETIVKMDERREWIRKQIFDNEAELIVLLQSLGEYPVAPTEEEEDPSD